MLLDNIGDDKGQGENDEEWKSPLLELETHSVSMEIGKSDTGFFVKGINTTEGYTFE